MRSYELPMKHEEENVPDSIVVPHDDVYLTFRHGLGIVVVLVVLNGCSIHEPYRFGGLYLKEET